MMPVIGEILGGTYQIISEIGTGGAGVIFLAYHQNLCKYVVVKKLKEQVSDRLNIRGEADTLKKLHHQYLPQVYDFLVIGNEIFTVMDYVDGHDLNWYIKNGIVFSEQELICMLIQLTEVLSYLHGQNPPIIHRDIKPGNIMIRENGEVCLIDFNISFSESSQTFVGYSYQYAPPEQIELARRAAYEDQIVYIPDARADIYSLGATFFYLMTGVRPRDIRAQEYQKGGAGTAYSADLLRIIQKAMETDPKKRYQSAVQMRKAVERKTGRTRRILLTAASGCAVLAVILGIMTGIINKRNQTVEAFAGDYLAYVSELSAGNTEDWIQDGIALLNQEDYIKLLTERPKQKAVILGSIADGYYEEENYSAAAEYYREALLEQTDPIKQAENARDLILSLIRDGQTREAELELQMYREILSEASLQYVEAEFLLEEGRTKEALVQIDQLLESVQDSEILLRCCLYGAGCLEGTAEYEQRMRYLERAGQYVSTLLAYRRIGDAYLRIIQEEP